MRHVPANQILLCADPLGAVHQQNTLNGHGDDDDDDEDDKKKGTKQYALGAAEFRKIYQEFWYILGYVALTEGGMATNTQQEEEEEEETSGSVVRLDAELIKEIIGRVIELAPVGQPDVRAGATLAVISMSHAVLDQSAQLVKKMDVASRQYQAAKKGKNTSKAEALKVRIDSLKRSAQDLEEVVTGNFIQGLFVHRYR
jgi:cohesin complex subunit SA-1/2